MLILSDEHNAGFEHTPLYPGITLTGGSDRDEADLATFEEVGAQLCAAGAKLRPQLARQSLVVRGVMLLGDSIAQLSDTASDMLGSQLRSLWPAHDAPVSMAGVRAIMCGLLRTRSRPLFRFWSRLAVAGDHWKEQRGLIVCFTLLFDLVRGSCPERFRLSVRQSEFVSGQLGLFLKVFPPSRSELARMPAGTRLCIAWPFEATLQATAVDEGVSRPSRAKPTALGKRKRKASVGAQRGNRRRGLYGAAYYVNSSDGQPSGSPKGENCVCLWTDIALDGADPDRHRIFSLDLSHDLKGAARGQNLEVELLWSYPFV